MKVFLFIMYYFLINITIYGSNLYFLNSGSGYIYTNGQTFNSSSVGYALPAYDLWADPAKYTIDEWGTREKDPNGIWSEWSHNSTPHGSVKCTKAGTWYIQGRAHVQADIYGYTDYWIYTDVLYFYVVDNVSPSIPTGIASEAYNNHPKISWNPNSEDDLDNYSIFKKSGGSSYFFLSTTSNTYYIDNSESIYSLGNDKTYVYYKVKANDINGNSSDFSNSVSMAVNAPMSKSSANTNFENSDSGNFYIGANYPNPFNPTTTITYQLPKNGYASLKIFNSLGQVVAILVDGYEEAGIYAVLFNAKNLPSGIYYAVLRMKNLVKTTKMILSK